MNPTDMTAMLFAAGLGTRLKPFTLEHPKALYPVNGKPLLQRNIEYLKSFGIQNFVINVHHFADQIIDFLAENNHFEVNISISDERGELLETGGGLLKAKSYLSDKPFLVMNSDILTDMNIAEIIAFHHQHNPLATLAVSDRESSRKLFFDTKSQLIGWKNLKNEESIGQITLEATELAFSGIHIISPEFFEKCSHVGKFSIMKPYMDLMSTEKIMGYNHTGSKILDVGKPHSAELAQKWFLNSSKP